MQPTVILWDWDNTLVDAWGGIRAALNDCFAAHGLPEWTLAETKQRVRGGMQESFQALFGADWAGAAALFRQRHAAHQLAELRPMPGLPGLLQAAGPLVQASSPTRRVGRYGGRWRISAGARSSRRWWAPMMRRRQSHTRRRSGMRWRRSG